MGCLIAAGTSAATAAAAAGGAGGGAVAMSSAALTAFTVAAVGLAVAITSNVINAMFGFEEAIKNNTDRLSKMSEVGLDAVDESAGGGKTRGQLLDEIGAASVQKEVNGFINLFGANAARGWNDFVAGLFGGETSARIEARAKGEAVLAQLNAQKAKNEKEAAEALQDFKDGTISASEALETMTKNQAAKRDCRLEGQERAAIENEKSTGFGAVMQTRSGFHQNSNPWLVELN